MTVDQILAQIDTLRAEIAALLNPVNTAPMPPVPENMVLEPYGIVNPSTVMTIFGLQWDGKTPDPGDNGKGAWGANTRNPDLVGCALPIKLLTETFGGLTPDHIQGNVIEVYSHVTEKTVYTVDIVDEGPAAWTHRLIDGTWGLHKSLGHIDYGLANYGDYSKWPAGFHVSCWITNAAGKAVEIKGVDFAKGRITGS